MQALVSRGRKGTGWGPRGCLAPGSVGSWCPAACVSPVPVITGQRGRECPVTQPRGQGHPSRLGARAAPGCLRPGVSGLRGAGPGGLPLLEPVPARTPRGPPAPGCPLPRSTAPHAPAPRAAPVALGLWGALWARPHAVRAAPGAVSVQAVSGLIPAPLAVSLGAHGGARGRAPRSRLPPAPAGPRAGRAQPLPAVLRCCSTCRG